MMKRLLGVCVLLVLMGSSAYPEIVFSNRGVQLYADQFKQMQEYVKSQQEEVGIGFQADFESGGATVCGTLVAVKNNDAASIDMDAVLLDGIKVLAAAIDPVHAAQTYLALNKQIMDGVCLSLPDLFAPDSTGQDKDLGTVMAQMLQKMFDAIGAKQLDINVMFYAMGKDATKAIQQALQQYMQTAVNQMQEQLNNLAYASIGQADVRAQAINIMRNCLNGILPAMATCLEQYFPIDRKALGL